MRVEPAAIQLQPRMPTVHAGRCQAAKEVGFTDGDLDIPHPTPWTKVSLLPTARVPGIFPNSLVYCRPGLSSGAK